ncbi:MAG TPA: choice-of-anchor tandem repeat NxxGxxAF-containing protein, partial [Planctomycetota bacterium]|nr:choice-of-anchor tandem repeat NxxGxxAF-containing protein [Planctomycetota bacterium]
MSFPLPRGTSALLVLSLACTSAAAQSLLSQYGEVIMAVGSDVPGLPGVTINSAANFDGPIIDQNGTVLFRARMVGGGVSASDDRAYFMGRNSADLRVVLRSGDQAPGLAPGILMRTATGTGPTGSPRISPFGEILFFSSSLYDGAVTVTAANDTALFWGPPSALTVLAREGDPVIVSGVAPGYTYGSQSFSLQNNVINASGIALFSTQLLGAPADSDAVMIAGTPSGLLKVFQEGDVMGGAVVIPVSGTTTMSFINQINEAGWVLHEVRFSTTTGTATIADDRALAIWTPGSGDVLIAREGQQAPGLAAGINFATPASSWTVD